MKKKLIFLLGVIILLSGCTGDQETETEQVNPTGIINFAYNIEPSSIRQGDSAVITMSLSNFYEKPLENVEVRFEPTFSGINFRIDGPSRIEPSSTGTWIVDIQSTSGVVAKNYIFRPIICFDYSQTKRGYFRVAPETPSDSSVDYSTSEVGPLIININNLRGINAKQDFNSLDITINYAYANTFQGLTNNTSVDKQVLTYGIFEIDSKDLFLRALQGSTRIKNTTIGLDNYCTHVTSGRNFCTFPATGTTVYANSQFGFRINVSNTLESELATYFLNTINYTICLKPTYDFSLTVVKSQ
ncbi:MAG: hypothetical protein PHN56_00960 [Candidatus Nanoarchaeia archaeon]|nr:hypothetical protein [Candidatus Nanoarchaeia archaeon]